MVCETCREAVTEEGGSHLTPDEVAMLCKDMGADIVDHRCESLDEGGDCECACNG